MKVSNISWKIGGEAGFGIVSTGLIFSKIFAKKGYFVIDSNEYPSLIRGGHNTYTVRISSTEIFSINKKNNVSLGVSIALLNYDMEILKDVIKSVFSGKESEIVNLNIKSSELGYKYIKEKLKINAYELEIVKPVNRILVTGNDAVFLGAVRAGCKFYAAYPMTPSSSILHSFASVENDFNIVTKHAEDEIAVINMVLGASYAGARAMAATSGGGFSLMNEGIGSAAMTETP